MSACAGVGVCTLTNYAANLYSLLQVQKTLPLSGQQQHAQTRRCKVPTENPTSVGCVNGPQRLKALTPTVVVFRVGRTSGRWVLVEGPQVIAYVPLKDAWDPEPSFLCVLLWKSSSLSLRS